MFVFSESLVETPLTSFMVIERNFSQEGGDEWFEKSHKPVDAASAG
jgi:hypothetical protein